MPSVRDGSIRPSAYRRRADAPKSCKATFGLPPVAPTGAKGVILAARILSAAFSPGSAAEN